MNDAYKILYTNNVIIFVVGIVSYILINLNAYSTVYKRSFIQSECLGCWRNNEEKDMPLVVDVTTVQHRPRDVYRFARMLL